MALTLPDASDPPVTPAAAATNPIDDREVPLSLRAASDRSGASFAVMSALALNPTGPHSRLPMRLDLSLKSLLLKLALLVVLAMPTVGVPVAWEGCVKAHKEDRLLVRSKVGVQLWSSPRACSAASVGRKQQSRRETWGVCGGWGEVQREGMNEEAA
jgi:hypothetical protein